MKLPFTFGVKLLFRLLLPGFLLSLGLWPVLQMISQEIASTPAFEYIFSISVILMGWLISSMDMPIYMSFEGRRFWPETIRNFFFTLEKKRLAKTIECIEKYRETKRNRYLEASVDIRQFPMNDEGKYIVRYPTRLGNLITAYEEYPKIRYGVDAIFYYYRIWLLMNKDLREEIDSRQAIVDSTVYTVFVLYLNAFLYLFYSIINVTSKHMQLNILISKYLFQNYIMIFLFFSLLITGYFIYRVTLHVHREFGEIFKSIFDNFYTQLEISKVIEEVSELSKDSSIKSVDDRQKFRIAWRYLHNYRIRCMKCNKNFPPHEIEKHTCNQ